MSIDKLINEPVTLHHRGVTGTDSRNNQTIGTTSSEPDLLYIEQTGTSEVLEGRETYVRTFQAYGLADKQRGPRDQIERADGTLLEILGEPNVVPNPRLGSSSHVEFEMRSVSG